MKLSLEQFLNHLDVEVEAGLVGMASDRKGKERLWPVINAEEDRVAALRKDFDYEFVLTPRVLAAPFPGGNMVLAFGYRIEGEAERKLAEKEWKVSPMFKVWPFKPIKIQTID